MGRGKRSVRGRPRAAPAPVAAEPVTEPATAQQAALLRQLASVSLSYLPPADEPEHHSADEASPASDSDAPRRPRKQRKRVGHYNKPLNEYERLELLRLHISS